jgi:hypothetical protein
VHRLGRLLGATGGGVEGDLLAWKLEHGCEQVDERLVGAVALRGSGDTRLPTVSVSSNEFGPTSARRDRDRYPRTQHALAEASADRWPRSVVLGRRGLMRGRTNALSSLALLFAVLLSAACGASSPEATAPVKSEQPPGASSPEQTVRAYVEGINAHNGKAVCALLLDSAAYELRIPDSDWGECPKFVSAYIGYVETNPDDKFQRAQIVAIERGEAEGELLGMKVSLTVERGEGRDPDSLEDVIWLVQRDGRWRVAKPSGLLYAAFGSYQLPANLLDAPDLAAQERKYQKELESEREQEDAEQATFTKPEEGVLYCGGPETAYDDVGHDLYFQGDRKLTRAESNRYATADLRRVEVDVDGDDVCARFTLADGKVEELLLISFNIYSPEQNTSYGAAMELLLEVQRDGRVRLAYEDIHGEEDDYGRHPIVAMPGRIAREGNIFSLRANRDELLRVMRDRDLPLWSGFLWGGMTFYEVTLDGHQRSVSDDLHRQFSGVMVSHPGGRVFVPDDRAHGDLPTD